MSVSFTLPSGMLSSSEKYLLVQPAAPTWAPVPRRGLRGLGTQCAVFSEHLSFQQCPGCPAGHPGLPLACSRAGEAGTGCRQGWGPAVAETPPGFRARTPHLLPVGFHSCCSSGLCGRGQLASLLPLSRLPLFCHRLLMCCSLPQRSASSSVAVYLRELVLYEESFCHFVLVFLGRNIWVHTLIFS